MNDIKRAKEWLLQIGDNGAAYHALLKLCDERLASQSRPTEPTPAGVTRGQLEALTRYGQALDFEDYPVGGVEPKPTGEWLNRSEVLGLFDAALSALSRPTEPPPSGEQGTVTLEEIVRALQTVRHEDGDFAMADAVMKLLKSRATPHPVPGQTREVTEDGKRLDWLEARLADQDELLVKRWRHDGRRELDSASMGVWFLVHRMSERGGKDETLREAIDAALSSQTPTTQEGNK